MTVARRDAKAVIKELSSCGWSGIAILRCLGSFFWHTHCQFGNFRVVDDFGLDWT